MVAVFLVDQVDITCSVGLQEADQRVFWLEVGGLWRRLPIRVSEQNQSCRVVLYVR